MLASLEAAFTAEERGRAKEDLLHAERQQTSAPSARSEEETEAQIAPLVKGRVARRLKEVEKEFELVNTANSSFVRWNEAYMMPAEVKEQWDKM